MVNRCFLFIWFLNKKIDIIKDNNEENNILRIKFDDNTVLNLYQFSFVQKSMKEFVMPPVFYKLSETLHMVSDSMYLKSKIKVKKALSFEELEYMKHFKLNQIRYIYAK